MLLQNTLDLSTFEIVRFRIWNQTSNPNDYGIGTKYFNTNSGHEGYNRENIYTATGWRRAAYLDDIDKINEKLDLIFGDELDTDTIIDSWKEVQDFLAGIEDTKNLMTMLDGKLDKTGGIMAENAAITWGAEGGPFIRGNGAGGLFLSSSVLQYRTLDGNNFYDIIHSGNVGEHTAGAANKLADDTAYTVWGRTFFENGKPKNVSNAPILNNNSGLYFKNAAGDANKLLFYFDTAEQLHIGRDSATDKNATHIYGNPTYFKSSNTGQPLVTITEEGNVLVGVNNADDYTFAAKNALFAIGLQSTNPTTPKELDAENLFSLVNTSSSRYGLHAWILNGGSANIQSARADGVNDNTYALNLNPLGGAVNIGSTNSYTNVIGPLQVATQIYVGNSSSSYIMMQREGYNYIWANKENSSIMLGIGETSNKATLAIYKGSIEAGTTNAVSLGSSSYRWSNVYSVSGNFSGTITVGESLTSSKPNGGTYPRWRITHEAGGLYIQSGTYDGKATNGILNLTGINNEGLTNFNVKATVSNFSKRVLINGVPDDGTSALQWAGTAKTTNNTYGNIEIRTARGLSWHAPASISSWTRGLYAYDNSNSTPLGIFGFKGAEQVLEHAFIGNSATSPWFTINSTESNFNVLTNFNAGALIPTGQTLTIGSVTFRETAEGEVEVDGNLHTTGTLASGGKGEVGENTTGNAMVYQYDLASGESVYTVDNVKGSTNVIVQIFEWNGNTSSWDMILTDVSVKADAITVTFGRTTTVNHMVTVC